MTEIESRELELRLLKDKEAILSDIEQLGCPLCGSKLTFNQRKDYLQGYFENVHIRTSIRCNNCGVFGIGIDRTYCDVRVNIKEQQLSDIKEAHSIIKKYAK